MEKDIIWKLIQDFFKSNRYFVTKHHLDSYNDFIDHMIPRVIETLNPISISKFDHGIQQTTDEGQDPLVEKHRIEMYIGGKDGKGVYFDHPTITQGGKTRYMFPNDARLHDLTYAANLHCDVEIHHYNKGEKGQVTKLDKVKIGRIPIMLHSKLCILSGKTEEVLKNCGECIYDQGGYFIVDGKEKVIVTQERNITNQIFIHESRDPKFSYDSFIRCTSENDSVFPKRIDLKVISGNVHGGMRKNAIVMHVPHLKNKSGIPAEIPLFVLFRCLGVESDLDILKHIIGNNLDTDEGRLFLDFLYASVTDGNIVYSKKQALAYLKPFSEYNTEQNVEFVLKNNLFPNIEYNFNRFDQAKILPEDNERNDFILNSSKAMFLGHIVNKLIKVCLGIHPPTDRDNYMFRRVAISGFLVGDIFKDFYNKFRLKARNQLERLYDNGDWNSKTLVNSSITDANKNDVFDSLIITTGLTSSLKGSWGLNKEQLGIVQDLNRISYMSMMSHLRLVSSPMDPSIKLRKPHELNTSQFGIMCPVESPDGQSIGLLKNFAIMCHVSFTTKSANVLEAIKKYFDITFLENLLHGGSLSDRMIKIMMNNTWIAVIDEDEAPHMVHFLKLLRRNALINIFTSISWDVFGKSINILTEGGRCSRPLLIVDDKQEVKLFKNKKLIKQIMTNKLDSWYGLTKGDTLPIELFNIYNDKFHDPLDVLNIKTSSKDSPSQVISKSVRDKVIEILEKNSAPLEFLDVEEVNRSMIAMYPDDLKKSSKYGDLAHYTHVEIHPSLMLSVYSSTIALANHNQAPRNIFSAAQGKQAIGIYATNFNNRIDTMSYILHYPQRKLVSTRFSDYLKMDDMPNGENLIVAISTFLGYNQEDSIIYNKSSVERGMFNITSFKSYRSEEILNEQTGDRVIFADPYELKKQGKPIDIRKYADYTKIDQNGIPKLNEHIREGNVIVGRVKIEKEVSTNQTNLDEVFNVTSDEEKLKYINMVEIADKTIDAKIDKVYLKQNYTTGQRDLKVRLRKFKIPELGDKAASTHGQKGICGLIVPASSMPFTKEGIVPDIIINPHAIPSRMTIGHLLECVLSKVAVQDGTYVDGTPFDHTNLDYFYDRLQENGFERHGNEILYDGQSGTQIQTDIFFGPTYYYRLKHMVSDKINFRDTGRVLSMTMQPTKGRSNEGGLRIGEMETNGLISHGMSSFMKESLMERSDKHRFYVDKYTGEIIGVNPKMDVYHGHKHISAVEIPYAFKLLTQELNTMCIMPCLKVDERFEIDKEAKEERYHDFVHEYLDLDDLDMQKEKQTENSTLVDNFREGL